MEQGELILRAAWIVLGVSTVIYAGILVYLLMKRKKIYEDLEKACEEKRYP